MLFVCALVGCTAVPRVIEERDLAEFPTRRKADLGLAFRDGTYVVATPEELEEAVLEHAMPEGYRADCAAKAQDPSLTADERAYFRGVLDPLSRYPELRSMDFTSTRLAVVACTFPTGMVRLGNVLVSEGRSTYEVEYEILTPPAGSLVTCDMGYGLAVIELPADGKQVRFVKRVVTVE